PLNGETGVGSKGIAFFVAKNKPPQVLSPCLAGFNRVAHLFHNKCWQRATERDFSLLELYEQLLLCHLYAVSAINYRVFSKV
ncbi:MAG: hypothetical protein QGD94_06250, partial [Planctomycetia bacterium]|nr:hypothetical protein [Planctomycetia bacterium]